jgi:HEAT repeat protein
MSSPLTSGWLRGAAHGLTAAAGRLGRALEPWFGPPESSPGLAAEAHGLVARFARLAGGAEAARDVVRAAAAARPEALWAALESFAATVSGEEWEAVSRALGALDETVRERRHLRHPTAWRRALAARRIGLLHDPGSVAELRRAMERGPAIVTLTAALALARMGEHEALRWLLDHPEATARRSREQLAAVIRRFGAAAAPIVRDTLEAWSPTAPIHLAAIEALGAWRDRAAVPLLTRLLADGGAEARTAAARALGLAGDVGVAAALIAALDDYAWPVRAQAGRALGELRAPGAVPRLAARVHDRAWWVRRNAAYALASCGPRGRAALRALKVQHADPYAAQMAAEVLQRMAWARSGSGGVDRVA